MTREENDRIPEEVKNGGIRFVNYYEKVDWSSEKTVNIIMGIIENSGEYPDQVIFDAVKIADKTEGIEIDDPKILETVKSLVSEQRKNRDSRTFSSKRNRVTPEEKWEKEQGVELVGIFEEYRDYDPELVMEAVDHVQKHHYHFVSNYGWRFIKRVEETKRLIQDNELKLYKNSPDEEWREEHGRGTGLINRLRYPHTYQEEEVKEAVHWVLSHKRFYKHKKEGTEYDIAKFLKEEILEKDEHDLADGTKIMNYFNSDRIAKHILTSGTLIGARTE
jgi:hypothetical protein